MSENFTRKNPALEKEIAACRSSEEISAVLLRYQELNGMPTKFDRVALPGSAGTSSPQRVAAAKEKDETLLCRIITRPDGSQLLLEAWSFSGLDFLELEARKQF